MTAPVTRAYYVISATPSLRVVWVHSDELDRVVARQPENSKLLRTWALPQAALAEAFTDTDGRLHTNLFLCAEEAVDAVHELLRKKLHRLRQQVAALEARKSAWGLQKERATARTDAAYYDKNAEWVRVYDTLSGEDNESTTTG